MVGLQSLITSDTKIKVSSTLDKSVGRQHLTDQNSETCWSSQQGLPQWIQVMFACPVLPHRLSLTFQGGFVGTRCAVHVVYNMEEGWEPLVRIYPEDVNRRQEFDIELDEERQGERKSVSGMKLVFEQSSDLFGRVTIYDLKIEGFECTCGLA